MKYFMPFLACWLVGLEGLFADGGAQATVKGLIRQAGSSSAVSLLQAFTLCVTPSLEIIPAGLKKHSAFIEF